jgi:phosphoglycerol transferase MdoB-like AlkP superfamily enzyme
MSWIQKNFKSLIYFAFLVPILTVAFVSISHVAKWYGLSNPISWAIYLSIGIEIAALSALAAISAQMGRKVYFPFAIVTLIQFIGNIFFAYQYINVSSESFKDWIDLVDPLVSFMGVESGDIVGHKRFLALFSGGMLPIISLSFLHMLVKFEEEEKKKKVEDKPVERLNVDIDELSIEAGKQEAKYVEEKYSPTEEELQLLEQKLREINENKFKSLE